jgi:N-acetylmuramoyl-L-alanine amidase
MINCGLISAVAFFLVFAEAGANSLQGAQGEVNEFSDSHPLAEDGRESEVSSWADFFAKHQRVATREDFFRCLYSLVPKGNLPSDFVTDLGTHAEIKDTEGNKHTLYFARTRSAAFNPNRYWRHPTEVKVAGYSRPLSGARIGIDPGHLGGRWAGAEGRLFYADCGTRIAEGDMNLEVAFRLRDLLGRAGAEVWLTRSSSTPLNGNDPSVFLSRAKDNLRKKGGDISREAVKREAARLHLQVAEIEARAELVNRKIRPDLVICLHFNAEPWGKPEKVILSPRNHLHVLVGGSYLPDELSKSENRLDLLRRALEGTHLVEIPLARSVADGIALETGLPAFSYGDNSRVADPDPVNPYVWKRNLLATRKFHCPVVYAEPYVMNNRDFIREVSAAGKPWALAAGRNDVFDRYARGVFRGIMSYWTERSMRPNSPPTREAGRDGVFRTSTDPYAPQWIY